MIVLRRPEGPHYHTFIDSLTDTPATYSGSSGKYIRVKSDISGLEFVTISDDTTAGYPKYYIPSDVAIHVGDYEQYVIHDRLYLEVDGSIELGIGAEIILTTSNALTGNVKTGREALLDGASSAEISFASPFADTDYSVSIVMRNAVDSPPSIYLMMVTLTTVSGFTTLFSGNIDSNNYFLDWTVQHD